jgi:hypothetical protein
MLYLTKEDIDFESSPEDLITFMANKDAIAADREAIVHFFQLGVYSITMPEALDVLYAYSKFKFSAMTCRENGYIQAAKHLENLADAEYNKLPKYTRW